MQNQGIVGGPPDIELGVSRDGYPALATWIARDPDNESYVFRKFDRLSARNLLNLQSRLIALEEKLDKLDQETRQSQDFELRQSARRWETFAKNAEDPDRPEERKRMELVMELQVRIKEYHILKLWKPATIMHGLFSYFQRAREVQHVMSDVERSNIEDIFTLFPGSQHIDEALLLQTRIANLDRPSHRVLTTFRNWFNGESQTRNGRKGNPILSGRAKYMLDDEQDLAALRPPADKDALSRFLQDYWPFQGKAYPDPRDNTRHFLERHVVWAVAIISTSVAAVLFVGAITSLYFVTSPGAKLAMISGFTVLFALSVGLLTNAKRGEMFAATAAYAAVLVVFVSGDLGNTQHQSPG